MNDFNEALSFLDMYYNHTRRGINTVTTERIDDGEIKRLRKENVELKNKLHKLQEDYNELLEEMREC